MKYPKHNKLYIVRSSTVSKILTTSKKSGSDKIHLLAIKAMDGFYMSHANNIYAKDITLCGHGTNDSDYVKSEHSVTCKNCLRIMGAHFELCQHKGELKCM